MVTVDESKFPWRPVIILEMCMTVNSYTLANLYPYVGVMAKHLLGLPTMNDAGELKECPIVFSTCPFFSITAPAP